MGVPDPDRDTPSITVDYGALVADAADVNTVATIGGVYRYVSAACSAMFGWNAAEMEGRRQTDFVHPDDVSLLSVRRGSLAVAKTVTSTYRMLCRDGSHRWVEATSRHVESGDAVFVVSTLRDMAERQRSDVTLQRQALSDPLTGVANRTVLMDRLHQALRRQQRGEGILAVLYVDLDRFKVINDSLGHRAGDAVLTEMAERLTHHLRPADTLARLGGDEFVIVAEGVASEDAAIELAKRITEAGRAAFAVGDEEFVCTLSVGIACTADSQRSAQELLQEADLALYRAKDLGRDRAEVFDEDLRTKAIGRLTTERMVRRALQEERIVVEYQPIVDLRTHHPVGAEALVRIDDPERGLLQPASFLEVAEETGLLIDMDELVLADAVHQAAAWHVRLGSDVEVAINVTARHLADVGLAKSVIELLDAHGVPRHILQIEVTERVLMEASNSAMVGLRALRDLGIQVGLDDFGTGYSSLAYLRQFPLDFVKIDRSFISGLDRVVSEQAIVAAIITLCHALGLTVIAEGVETQGQLRVLESLGCDRGQGFLFGRPGEPSVVNNIMIPGSRAPSR
jgi:diguanylate cyclase (GGDEF)-like protein/PAS domain S-box-containing protein